MEHVFHPKTYYYTYGVNEPAYHIKPGDFVLASTLDAGGSDCEGRLIPEDMKHRVPGINFRESNPLTGPFYVEGAEAGDTLAIKIEEINLNRSTAYSRIGPHFGCLTEEVPGRRILLNEPLKERHFYWDLDLEESTGYLKLPGSSLGGVEIPLHPFIGSIGVAPRFGRVEMSLTPGEFGGNMDCVETRAGVTLYLPVFAPGGYLVFGDIHAAQGDGELCGVALETTAEVKLKVDVIKGKSIDWPRVEDEEWVMTIGSSRPLMEAFRIAHLDMVGMLETDYGFDRMEGFQVFSQVGRCRVGNVVDPNYTVVAKFPKKYLPGKS